MDDLAVFVIGWDESGNECLAERLRTWGGIPHVYTYCNYGGSEAENINHCLLESERMGYKYMLFTDSDVEFNHEQTIPEMYKWISATPKCGSIRPWRCGEQAQVSHYPPDKKYIDDGTAVMMRLNTGTYMDTEFLFTGWADLDLGQQMELKGYDHYNDRRYPVRHSPVGSDHHRTSSILQAIKKSNKLRLDFKWHKVGIDNWHGTNAYNASVPVEERIPTLNQMVSWSNEDQERFQQSVSPEHNFIWVKDHHINPNMTWRNPLMVGYSTREEFEEKYGYS